MLEKRIKRNILGNFFTIELSSGERAVAEHAVHDKYLIATKRTIIYMIGALFPMMFLDTSIIISVLIPITMVAGTAWFAISLANMKQKFENFGSELTTNLFEAFTISLGLLFLLSILSLSSNFRQKTITSLPYQSIRQGISFLLGSCIIGNIIYKIFLGSIKYDINDAMLTGQHEAAEKFYRKSLSLLYSVADSLRDGKSIQVANYYIGVAFFEVFSYLEHIDVIGEKVEEYKNESNTLIKNPSMSQQEADKISTHLINTFISYCKNPQTDDSQKSLEAIHDELRCLSHNDEDQEMVDTRFAIIFQEIASLLEGQGETLFTVSKKIR